MDAKLALEIVRIIAAGREIAALLEAALSAATAVNAEPVTDEVLAELKAKREAALARLVNASR